MIGTFRASVAAALVIGGIAAVPGHASAQTSGVVGRWNLNRHLSQFPQGIGFGMDVIRGAGIPKEGSAAAAADDSGFSSGRVAPGYLETPESEEEAQRQALLVGAVRNPAVRFAIEETTVGIVVKDDRGVSFVLHPTGREETIYIDRIPVPTIARWDGPRLEVRYKVQRYRELRYVYSRSEAPARLTVQVEFIERGGRDVVTRVYDPLAPGEALVQAAPRPALGAASALPPAPAGMVRAWDGRPASGDAPGAPPAPVTQNGPDPELRGLATVGLVVEDVGSQAAACGLSQEAIDAVAAKSLGNAGVTVRRNGDEDTYLYVRIVTITPSAGQCVSKTDAYLFSHTMATLSHQSNPVLVQVLLLKEGGLTGSTTAVHAATIQQAVTRYVDSMAARIRNANK
jgi:hypothetical protein